MSTSFRQTSKRHQRGVVLPVAMIMLVIISFAGLMAARNSVVHERFANNMRTNQVARQMAETALRYCERVAMDKVDNEGETYTDVAKIVESAIASEDVDDLKNGSWHTLANWVGTDGKQIKVSPTYGGDVSSTLSGKQTAPLCMIETMAVENSFVITARGFSADAVVDDPSGQLTAGSEVWLQSILSPGHSVASADLGVGGTSSK